MILNETKNLIVYGTRPEAIKMAPLVKEVKKKNNQFETKVCITAQHREMLVQVLAYFERTPDLDLMQPNQTLYSVTANIFQGLKPVLEEFQPDYVYVHGDNTTTMAESISAFYFGSKICHVEAGLRTFNKKSPFPEEINRSVTGVVSDIHFTPTETSKLNLLNESKISDSILVTRNTVIDALKFSVSNVESEDFSDTEMLTQLLDFNKKLVLVTGHRREDHGQGFIDICEALKQLVYNQSDIQIVYPVYLNPNFQKPVYDILTNVQDIKIITPLSYPAFVWLMNKAHIIITDSGGVPEEAPSLGKPVLVMRNTTEWPEAVEAGTVVLVETDKNKIVSEASKLLSEDGEYQRMSKFHNPYGYGDACKRIVDHIIKTEHE